MKIKIFLIAVAICFLGVVNSFAASVTGHFTPGGSGIKPAIVPRFLGLVYRLGVSYQEALSMRDGSGNTTAEPFSAKGFTLAHKFVYTPDMERISFLGNAQYHMQLILPTTYAEMSAPKGSFDSFGVGDSSFFPFALSWDFDNLQLMYFSGAFLPIGDFDKNNPTSLGKGFYTWVNLAGFTWWIDDKKDWCISILSRFEKHFKTKDKDLRQGCDLSFEWSFSKNITKEWEVGVCGYNLMQVTDDKGSAAFGLERDEVHGIGMEVQYTNLKKAYQIGLRTMRDYKVEGRPETWNVTSTFTFLF